MVTVVFKSRDILDRFRRFTLRTP